MTTRTRRELTITEKLAIIDHLKGSKCSRKEIQERFQCNATTISRILKNETQLRNNSNERREKTKRIRPGNLEKLDKAVSQWFYIMRERNAFINGPILKEQASKFAKMLNINTFEPSNGWLWRWQKKENICFKSLHEQRNSIAAMLGGKSKGNKSAEGVDTNDMTPDRVIIDEIEINDDDIKNVVAIDTGVDVELIRDEDAPRTDEVVPKRDEACKALDTLVQYLCAKGVKARSLEDVEKYLKDTTSGSEILETTPNHQEEFEEFDADRDMNATQDDSINYELQETTEKPYEIPDRKNKRMDMTDNIRDQYSVYGEHIAHRLRNCHKNTQEVYIAQHNIDDILFRLSMGAYNQAHSNVLGAGSRNKQKVSSDSRVSDSFDETQSIVTKTELDF